MRPSCGVFMVAVLAGLLVSCYGQEVRRAPSMGFMGMRGKKDLDLPDQMYEQYKRAPLAGFQGMRGKKAPNMGFMGMRGKKDDFPEFWDDEEKRAPSAGFFGTRGKKAPSSGFFGTRGKKAPSSGFFGTRGKKGPSGFIGMRGKKDELPEDVDSLLYYLRAAEPRLGEEDLLESRAKRFAAEENFQEPLSEEELF